MNRDPLPHRIPSPANPVPSSTWTLRVGVIGLALTVCLLACSSGEEGNADHRPVIVVSVQPMATFVERIAGDRVAIEVMIPPGASPATHEPTFEQLKAVSRAALYVKVGHPNFPFEAAWLDELMAQNSDLTVIDGSAGVDQREGDPHVWVSPGCVRIMADNIAASLTALLPSESSSFEERRAEFSREIDGVDAAIRKDLEGYSGRRFLVLHPAWGYFAAEYDLIQVAIEHEHKEPGPHELGEVIEHAREEGIRVVFVQPQFSRQNADLIAGEIQGQVVFADPLAADWARSLRGLSSALREAFSE